MVLKPESFSMTDQIPWLSPAKNRTYVSGLAGSRLATTKGTNITIYCIGNPFFLLECPPFLNLVKE
jgi:hypothetical protein